MTWIYSCFASRLIPFSLSLCAEQVDSGHPNEVVLQCLARNDSEHSEHMWEQLKPWVHITLFSCFFARMSYESIKREKVYRTMLKEDQQAAFTFHVSALLYLMLPISRVMMILVFQCIHTVWRAWKPRYNDYTFHYWARQELLPRKMHIYQSLGLTWWFCIPFQAGHGTFQRWQIRGNLRAIWTAGAARIYDCMLCFFMLLAHDSVLTFSKLFFRT